MRADGAVRASAARRLARVVLRPRPLTLSERRGLLVGVDLAIVIGALVATHSVDASLPSSLPMWALTLSAIWLLVAATVGAYDLVVAAHPARALQRVTIATLVSLALHAMLPLWSPPLPESRLEILLGLGATLLPLLAWRGAYAVWLTRASFRIRTLIVGRGRTIQQVQRLLRTTGRRDYEVVGQLLLARGEPAGTPSDRLLEGVRSSRAAQIVVDPSLMRSVALQPALLELSRDRVAILTSEEMYSALTGRVLLRHAAMSELGQPSPWASLYQALRRVADVAVAVAALVVLSPLLALAVAAVAIESGRPILYHQRRVGQGGRVFGLHKLRTMIHGAEADGQPRWAARRDPRVTRVGGLLRRCHLDEAPQLWNVLRGDMSLIGPRPERPEFASLLAEKIPLYSARQLVPPGITGWAQVKFRYGSSVADAATKLQYDLYYIRNQSPFLDAVILVKTLFVIARLKGI